MANKTFVSNGTFTVADNDAVAFGASVAGTEIVKIQSGVTGVKLDANFEQIVLSGNLSTYKFLVVSGTGVLIKNVVGSATVASIPNINSLSLKIAFTNGSAELRQTGGTAFTLNNSVLPAVLYTTSAIDTSAAALVITLTGENVLNSAAAEISTLGTEHKFNATSSIDTFTASSGVDVFVGKFGLAAVPSTVAFNATDTVAETAKTFAITLAGVNSGNPITIADLSAATDGATLATAIQAALRNADGSATDISVTWSTDILTITDAKGRAISVPSLKDEADVELDATITTTNGSVAHTATELDATITSSVGISSVHSYSPLATMDTITSFAIGTDKIDLLSSSGAGVSTPTALTRGANVAGTGNLVTDLTTAFGTIDANTAKIVVVTGTGAGTYLYVNDSTPAFSATEDLFISLVGVTGTLGVAGSTLIASDFFA